jgi:hypothetical protein
MFVTLRHPGTGSVKMIESGWSWSLFLGASFLGLPLFFRGLSSWGVVMFIAWMARIGLPLVAGASPEIVEMEWLLSLVVGGLCLFLGFKGNDLSAQHFLACGYEESDNRSFEDRVSERLQAIDQD